MSDKIKRGVDAIADVVKRTYGPAGSTVLIERKYGLPSATKDGVSVASEIFLEDSDENIAAQLVKEASVKSGEVSGDGTTGAVVLAQAIYTEALTELADGKVKPLELKKQILSATEHVVSVINDMSRPVEGEELKRVAEISANDEAAGAIVYEVLGKDPTRVVAIEESSGLTTEIEVVDGLRLDRGFISPYLMTDVEKGEAVLNDAAVLVVDGKLTAAEEIAPSMRCLAANNIKTLLIVADEFDTNALQMMVVNTLKGSFSCLGVKNPGFGQVKLDNASDIAAVTGATVFGGPSGAKLSDPQITDFGRVRSVTSTKDHTTMVGGAGDRTKLEQVVANVKGQLAESKSKFDIEKLNNRLSRLVGGVSLIKVGGSTESEIKELRDRIEDAVQATVAAAEEGVLPGAGNALSVIGQKMQENPDSPGWNVVKRALLAPMATLYSNADIAMEEVQKWDEGFDLRTGKFCDSLLTSGIIDPAKVVRVSLQNAASVAATLASSSASLTYKEHAKSSRDV